ncbi:MAG: GNAT family N-acetyltransferase [Hyphomicrobiales bacterium]
MGLVPMQENASQSFEINVFSSFDFKGEEYAALFDKSEVTAFQSPRWLDAFYEKLCPILGVEPFIIAVRDGAGTLQMVLPMVRKAVLFAKIIQPADLGITDYNQIIASRETLDAASNDAAFKAQLLNALKPFDLLLFRKVRSDSFDIERLFDKATKINGDSAAHDLPMPMPFDEWKQATLSKSTRKGLDRKRRNIEKDVGPLTFKTLTDVTEIESAFEMLRLERGKKYPGDLLSQNAYYDFYLKVAKDGAATGEAVTIIGQIDGKTLTVDFGLHQDGRHLLLLGAFDSAEEFKKYSLGLQGILDVMKGRKEIGIDMFDFTTGDEDYKSSLHTTPVPMHHYILSNGVVGRIGQMAYQDNSFARKLVQRLMPNLK